MKTKRELYRDTQKGKIAGVCAGIADYFGWEVWLVRILFVSAVLLAGGPFFVVAYIAAWFILDKKPNAVDHRHQYFNFKSKNWQEGADEDDKTVEVKAKVWQAGEPPKQAFHDIKRRFEHLEGRLRRMETYVTSPEYQLNREISRL
ncbi:envelope stress response membrane protein PspC [Aliiglaciecola sp. CAU 1673]|uniref:envelope stress response membrane protein PspC n=1 Tax=Aliiglaciecola sp. CAU 1673 TaxID=3032595 RepID=UPI0023DCE87F|nr:envelope stress response membrane protein PspC [Aliiglaciecola sp. CAU 1673]MDF2179581.1 envelope stress response membrane protein PspC [Aliiglaciecola sp. CAU 1673]